MRIELELDDDLIRQVDELTGGDGRSRFMVTAIRAAADRADHARRWASLMRAAGSISDQGHELDEDVAAWVRESRRADPKSVGSAT